VDVEVEGDVDNEKNEELCEGNIRVDMVFDEDVYGVSYVRYPSVSLSLTLSENEKVEQHIRKKANKPNVLRFWVEVGVIPLCGSNSCLILVWFP